MLLPLIAGALLSTMLNATEVSTIDANARALSMGNAYTAVTDDASALFYNPARLSHVTGLNLTLLDARAGVSNVNAIKKISKLKTATGSDYASQLDGLYGNQVWSGVGAETSLALPLFALAVFDHGNATVRVDNPVNPAVDTYVINDFGYAVGAALPLPPFVQLGGAVKFIKRTGADLPFGASFLANLDPKDIYNTVNVWGRGVAVDLGANVDVPTGIGTWSLGAAWKNVGQTRYHSSSASTNLPLDDNDVTLGTALNVNLPALTITPSLDARGINQKGTPTLQKLNLGLQLSFPIVDIRGGFHEGYPTYGAGVDLGLVHVDAASYGVELGAYPGQIEDRRYMVEVTVLFSAGDFAYKADGASPSERTPSSYRLKRRR